MHVSFFFIGFLVTKFCSLYKGMLGRGFEIRMKARFLTVHFSYKLHACNWFYV